MVKKILSAVITSIDRKFTTRFIVGSSRRDERMSEQSLCSIRYYDPIIDADNKTYEQAVRNAVKKAIAAGPHIIAPVGVLATRIVREELTDVINRPFIFFTGTVAPEKLKFVNTLENPGRCITGIELEPVEFGFLAERILKLFSEKTSMLLPCTPHNLGGRIGHAAYQMKEYFESKGMSVTVLELPDLPHQEAAQKIKEMTTECDLIGFVLGDHLIQTVPYLSEFCKKRNIGLIGDTKEDAQSSNAVGFSNDIEFLGDQHRQYLEEIAHKLYTLSLHELENTNFPVRYIKNNFKTFLGDRVEHNGGIELCPDVIALAEEDPHKEGDPFEVFKDPEEGYTGIPRYNIHYFGPNTVTSDSLFKAAYFHKKKNDYIDLQLFKIDIPYEHNSHFIERLTDETEKIIAEHMLPNGLKTHGFIAYGCKAVQELEAIVERESLDIPVIGFVDLNQCRDCTENIKQAQYTEESKASSGLTLKQCVGVSGFKDETVIYFINEFCPTNTFDLLKQVSSTSIKQVLLPLGYAIDHESKERDALYNYAKEHSITLIELLCEKGGDLAEYLEENNDQIDAVLPIESFLTRELVMELGQIDKERMHTAVCSGFESGLMGLVPCAHGRNLREIGAHLIDYLLYQMFVESTPIIAFGKWYTYCATRTLNNAPVLGAKESFPENTYYFPQGADRTYLMQATMDTELIDIFENGNFVPAVSLKQKQKEPIAKKESIVVEL